MLYLCATPIGNLEDITLRVLRVLSEVSAIYCEDTRHSRKLLQHYNIDKKLISCHAHNEKQKAQEICSRVLAGESIAYLSDAGMPCISDPGERIIKIAIDLQAPYTVLPGATAFATALSISGYDSSAFAFYGFLDRTGKRRKEILDRIINSEITSIIYESPNRIASFLLDIAKYEPKRNICIVREITKIYEERIDGSAEELQKRFEYGNIKGECVVVVAKREEQCINVLQVERRIGELDGVSTKEIANIISDEFNINKNEAKRIILDKKKQSE